MNEDLHCCKYCRFMRSYPTLGEDEGLCQKNTPSIGEASYAVWPIVLHRYWCGSFDPNKEWDRIMNERRALGKPGEILTASEVIERQQAQWYKDKL